MKKIIVELNTKEHADIIEVLKERNIICANPLSEIIEDQDVYNYLTCSVEDEEEQEQYIKDMLVNTVYTFKDFKELAQDFELNRLDDYEPIDEY